MDGTSFFDLLLQASLAEFERLAAIPTQLWLAQLLIGLGNGAFYAMLSLGLAIIFGLLNVINFAHGALYMLGAFTAWMLLQYLGIGYWPALVLAPLIVAAVGIVLEKAFLSRLYRLDPLYSLLLTFGVALILEGAFVEGYGTSGKPYAAPAMLSGSVDLGFMRMQMYRGWAILASLAICFTTWFAIEKTRLGVTLRAATENPTLVQAFGINVPRVMTLTYAFGVGLAALAGVLAAPLQQVSPQMGSNTIIVIFAVVVIGGMGSIMGAIVTGLVLGVFEGLTRVIYPSGSDIVVFVLMVVVLLVRPAGLFGRER